MRDPFRLPQLVDPVRDWRELGLCGQTDPDEFHPDRGGSAAAAKKVCTACEVRRQCLEAALDTTGNQDHGVWGGTTEHERRAMRRERGAA